MQIAEPINLQRKLSVRVCYNQRCPTYSKSRNRNVKMTAALSVGEFLAITKRFSSSRSNQRTNALLNWYAFGAQWETEA
jgi:hypothetical protein